MRKITIALLTHDRKEKAAARINKIANEIRTLEFCTLLIIENPSPMSLEREEIPTQSNVKYYLKSRNQGLDRSIIQASCYAKYTGSRVWFVCDDDNIFYNKIVQIIVALSRASKLVCYVPWLQTDGQHREAINSEDAYRRMSFLPCVSVDPSDVNFSKLYPLIGTNYIHIALINQLLSIHKDIHLVKINVGLQERNKNTRFPVFDTFLSGYLEVLQYSPFLSQLQIEQLVYERSYAAISFLKRNNKDFKELLRSISFVTRLKGIRFSQKTRFILKGTYKFLF